MEWHLPLYYKQNVYFGRTFMKSIGGKWISQYWYGDGTKHLGVYMLNSVTGKGGFETQGWCVSVGFRNADTGSLSKSMLFFLHSRKPRAQQSRIAVAAPHSPVFLAHFYLCCHLSIFVWFSEKLSLRKAPMSGYSWRDSPLGQDLTDKVWAGQGREQWSRNAHLDNKVGHVQTHDECVREKDVMMCHDDSRFVSQESQRNGGCDHSPVTA